MGEQIRPCSRCGETLVINPRPDDDIVACEDCTWRIATAAAVHNFVAWVATSRAYNGSDHHVYAQSLYNDCLNSVLPEWAEEWLAESGRA